MTAALVVDDVSVRLGGRTVLEHVSLTAETGTLNGLVGPNGAGKTTLLRSILGLLPLATGSIAIDGASSARARRRLGSVPQLAAFAWDYPISVEEVVLTGRTRLIGWLRRAGKADYEAAYRALERVRMLDMRDRPIGELSGGQKQRVLVARALATDPQLLLLDEPFTGLDIPTQELLLDLFDELTDEGRALLMTTHDLTGAVHACDALTLVNRTVVATGTPSEIAPSAWIQTFGFREGSPLLAQLGVG